MAKVPRWERAWQHFRAGMFDGYIYNPGDGTTASRRKRFNRQREEYWRLVQLARDLGIAVYKGGDLGTATDASGDLFHVGGLWDPGKERIRLGQRSFPVLAHEMGHAVSYILVGHQSRAEGELTACGAGYVLTCHIAGMKTPRHDLAYARRQGATRETLIETEGHILNVFHELRSALQQ